jgi:hypothetical protein
LNSQVEVNRGSTFHGILIAIGLDNIAALTWTALYYFFKHARPEWLAYAVIYIGVVQFIWLGPMIAFLLLRKQPNTALGIGMIAGITLLLNSACVGLMFAPKYH